MIVQPITTRVFKEREDLLAFFAEHVPALKEGSVVVITSKIVALSEGRTAIVKSKTEKEALIRKESDFAMKTRYVWVTIRDSLVMGTAGIDESNGNGKLILMPKDSFETAEEVRSKLKKRYGLKDLGVIISDSRILPLRHGTVGVAIGYAGFKGLKPYKGKKDIFGRVFHAQRVDVVDSLATAAVFTMGEGNEQRPIAVIEGAEVEFASRVDRKELEVDVREDVYQPLFERIKKIRIRKRKR